MSDKPGIVIVSCSKTKPKSLIKLIANTREVVEDSSKPGLIVHPWNIDTKYYTAEVNLLGVEIDTYLDKELISNIEALIIHMDPHSKSGLEDLKKWDFLDNDYNLDIKLLLTNYCTDSTNITKGQALEWCLKRGFEFIELYPSVKKPEPDEVIPEKFGVDRVIEALHSHTWSNLIMKDKKYSKSSNQTKPKENIDISNSLFSNQIDDFSELFSQLQTMRDSLQGMPMNQRKQCAEQMVTAFWKATGGEEEELLDL